VNYSCKYCGKSYVRESTLGAHLCELKRRWQQQNEPAVQIALKSYLRFYEITQGSAKLKTYEDFVNSQFYLAFVKFGRYLTDIRAVNVSSFTDWLLKNNKKIDHWCKESVYSEWLIQYIKKESVQDALERSLKEMQDYADTEEKLASNFDNYFRHGSSNRICRHISDGRISPWVVFNCSSGVDWLNGINAEQLQIIMPVIDPDFWQQKFRDYLADVEWCKTILTEANL